VNIGDLTDLYAPVQARFVGDQFEDDLNTLVLEDFVVVDASATRQVTGALHAFVGVENVFDVEYDVGRTLDQ